MAITVKERKMKIDFTTSMTFYEFLAICLAFIGILIPIVQVIWKKWVVKTKLNFFRMNEFLCTLINLDHIYA